ncbi:MAG: cytochrome c3 family protein [Xanthobacteraceae bacterium]
MILSLLRAARVRHKAAIALALLGLALVPSAPAQDAGEAKLLPDAKGTDCAACHGSSNPLPQGHPPPAGKTFGDCAACHLLGTAHDLRGVLPLSHQHSLSGIACTACHADPKLAEPAPAGTCMGCHDADKVATSSAGVKPTNPHDSPHYGKRSNCNLCHHQHENSENFCSQCHTFDFKVP